MSKRIEDYSVHDHLARVQGHDVPEIPDANYKDRAEYSIDEHLALIQHGTRATWSDQELEIRAKQERDERDEEDGEVYD